MSMESWRGRKSLCHTWVEEWYNGRESPLLRARSNIVLGSSIVFEMHVPGMIVSWERHLTCLF